VTREDSNQQQANYALVCIGVWIFRCLFDEVLISKCLLTEKIH